MRESVWGYATIVLGITAIIIIWLMGNITRTDQHDYNLLKETTEAAMLDAIDVSQYRLDGTIRMDEETFVVSFLRRFADNADLSNTYKVDIYDVNETPPKVSIRVSTVQNVQQSEYNFSLTNNIDAILETKDYPYGDVNADGVIDLNDFECVNNYISNNANNKCIEKRADLDYDGDIDDTDENIILSLLGKIVDENHKNYDVNKDGIINSFDYYCAMKIVSKLDSAACYINNSSSDFDVNGDGKSNMQDARLIMRYIAGYKD